MALKARELKASGTNLELLALVAYVTLCKFSQAENKNISSSRSDRDSSPMAVDFRSEYLVADKSS